MGRHGAAMSSSRSRALRVLAAVVLLAPAVLCVKEEAKALRKRANERVSKTKAEVMSAKEVDQKGQKMRLEATSVVRKDTQKVVAFGKDVLQKEEALHKAQAADKSLPDFALLQEESGKKATTKKKAVAKKPTQKKAVKKAANQKKSVSKKKTKGDQLDES